VRFPVLFYVVGWTCVRLCWLAADAGAWFHNTRTRAFAFSHSSRPTHRSAHRAYAARRGALRAPAPTFCYPHIHLPACPSCLCVPVYYSVAGRTTCRTPPTHHHPSTTHCAGCGSGFIANASHLQYGAHPAAALVTRCYLAPLCALRLCCSAPVLAIWWISSLLFGFGSAVAVSLVWYATTSLLTFDQHTFTAFGPYSTTADAALLLPVWRFCLLPPLTVLFTVVFVRISAFFACPLYAGSSFRPRLRCWTFRYYGLPSPAAPLVHLLWTGVGVMLLFWCLCRLCFPLQLYAYPAAAALPAPRTPPSPPPLPHSTHRRLPRCHARCHIVLVRLFYFIGFFRDPAFRSYGWCVRRFVWQFYARWFENISHRACAALMPFCPCRLFATLFCTCRAFTAAYGALATAPAANACTTTPLRHCLPLCTLCLHFLHHLAWWRTYLCAQALKTRRWAAAVQAGDTPLHTCGFTFCIPFARLDGICFMICSAHASRIV
jgi:hypothetical protein